jgi:hypothetical protein
MFGSMILVLHSGFRHSDHRIGARITPSLRGLSDIGHFEKGDALNAPTSFLKGGQAALMVQEHEKRPFFVGVRHSCPGRASQQHLAKA